MRFSMWMARRWLFCEWKTLWLGRHEYFESNLGGERVSENSPTYLPASVTYRFSNRPIGLAAFQSSTPASPLHPEKNYLFTTAHVNPTINVNLTAPIHKISIIVFRFSFDLAVIRCLLDLRELLAVDGIICFGNSSRLLGSITQFSGGVLARDLCFCKTLTVCWQNREIAAALKRKWWMLFISSPRHSRFKSRAFVT